MATSPDVRRRSLDQVRASFGIPAYVTDEDLVRFLEKRRGAPRGALAWVELRIALEDLRDALAATLPRPFCRLFERRGPR
jgi:hypothetical protein